MRPGMGHSLMPSFKHHQQVHANEANEQAGNDEDVQREESRERVAGDDGAAQQQMHQTSAEKRNAAHDGDPDAQAPIGILIEAQHLAGEGHAQGHQQQKHADDPGQFAGKLVGSEQEHLRHVNQHQRDHEVGAPAVHSAQEPSQGDTVVEILQAVPGLGRPKERR